MIKTTLKRIFALVGSSLAPVAAVLYFILGIQYFISIADDVKTNFFSVIAFFLLFALAVCIAFFGAKVLFSFLNKEDDSEPFMALILSFTAFQFAYNLFYICFWGGDAATWLMLVFALGGTLTLTTHIAGINTAWYTDLIGVSIGILTAITAACASGGLMLVASIIMSVISIMVISIYSLHLIKEPSVKERDEEE